jgi:hypothetical protein
MTNLKDLLAKATVPPTQKLVKRSSKWETLDEQGVPVTYEFDFFIVEQISFAASDRIYLGSRTENDKSAAARAIVERVRLGEDGEEQLTLEQVHDLDPALGWALISAVNAFDKEKSDAAEEAKKRLSQMTNSGTNSSSTESVEGQ